MKNKRERILRETMYRDNFLGYQIRVWIQQPHAHIDKFKDVIFKKFCSLRQGNNREQLIKKLVEHILTEYPKVNAVEYTDSSGCGEVLYKDWP